MSQRGTGTGTARTVGRADLIDGWQFPPGSRPALRPAGIRVSAISANTAIRSCGRFAGCPQTRWRADSRWSAASELRTCYVSVKICLTT
jgi:hypothetical protein